MGACPGEWGWRMRGAAKQEQGRILTVGQMLQPAAYPALSWTGYGKNSALSNKKARSPLGTHIHCSLRKKANVKEKEIIL